MTTPNKILNPQNHQFIAQLITLAENYPDQFAKIKPQFQPSNPKSLTPVLGITGTGGAGKSSLVDELVRRFLLRTADKTIAIISVDPSKRKTGGALLGDRIRMNSINNQRVYMRSLATRQSNLALSKYVRDAIDICKAANFDLIIVETSGIGQSDTEITEHADVSLYVMTSEYGAATQLEKIDMLDFADLIAINKFDKRGSLDALRDVKKQYRRNRNYWEGSEEDLPVYGTIASQFNDLGMNILYEKIIEKIVEKTGIDLKKIVREDSDNGKEQSNNQTIQQSAIIPPNRVRYLAEITENSDTYDKFVENQCAIARKMYCLAGAIEALQVKTPATENNEKEQSNYSTIQLLYNELEQQLDYECKKLLFSWDDLVKTYTAEKYQFKVRDKILEHFHTSRFPK